MDREIINSKQEGYDLNKEKMNLETDDYLDLYLIAGKLEDKEWQQDILKQLQNYLGINVNKGEEASSFYDDNDDDLLSRSNLLFNEMVPICQAYECGKEA